jgi:vitamin B12 transporter
MRSLLFGSLLLLSAAPAFAEETEIIVTAARTQSTPASTTASVTVIERAEIEARQAGEIVDVLRTVPGVQVLQSGGLGQVAEIRLRGATSDQTLVLIDGAPINDPAQFGVVNFADIDAASVARVEIVRGAASAAWGADALGGVINIITRGEGEGLTAYAEAGALRTGRVGLRAGHAAGDWRFSGGLSGFGTEGVSAADERDGNSERDGARGWTGHARALLAMSSTLSLDAGLRHTDSRADIDEYGLVTGVADADAVVTSRASLADARAAWRLAALKITGSASYAALKRRYDTSFASRYDGARLRGGLGVDLQAGGGDLALGLEAERLSSEVAQAFSSFTGDDATTAGIYAAYARAFGPLNLEAAIRHERDDRYGEVTIPRIGARFSVSPSLSLRAAWGEGFKAPAIDEVTGGGFAAPNPNLKPERAEEWEAGLRFSQGGFEGNVVYFDRHVRDLIQYAPGGYFNIARVTVRGVEAQGRLAFAWGHVGASYAWTDAADDRGAPLIRIAEHTGALDASWKATTALTLSATAAYVGEKPDVNFGPFPSVPVTLDARVRVDIRAAYQLTDTVELYGRVENATAERVQDVFGYGVPGVGLTLGVRARY